MPTQNSRYVDLRGKTYYFRMRVPAEFADVEPLREINRSLRTRDRVEAEARCVLVRSALHAEWRSRRDKRTADVRDVFDASMELMKSWGMSFASSEDLLVGPIEELLSRIEAVANSNPSSIAVSAALGVVDLPDATFEEMATRMPELRASNIRAKTDVQRREWCGNFKRAARVLRQTVGKRTVLTVSDQDATDYEKHWKERVASGDVTANYANKQIRYVRQIVDAHFEDIRVPKPKRHNPFKGASVDAPAYADFEERKKPAFPEPWIQKRLVEDRILEDFCVQASDIAIVEAITGARASEIYNTPPFDINLDHEVPHLWIRTILEGEYRREIKNAASVRRVPLLGAALDAMRRNPEGFPRFRGKAGYSCDVNKHLREKELLPKMPSDIEGKYVISGLRHSFEDRMASVGMDHEERAFLMGHSIGKVRRRPVYGTSLDLPARALLQEMVTYPTNTWTPRAIPELWAALDSLIAERGFRTRLCT